MLTDFKKYLTKNALLTPSDKVLVAVSGGADSVVLLHLLLSAGYSCSVAHANFGLRTTESDQDESFMKALASRYQIRCFIKKFDTEACKQANKQSTQMAARELRYEWFHELAAQCGFDAIATGHHQDDQVESFFINLLRGAGLKGLKAMEARNGLVIRPLLFASRNQIELYANANGIAFRNDSSNQSLKYQRNQIRHQLIPVIQAIDPKAPEMVKKSISLLGQNNALYQELVSKALEKFITRNPDGISFDIKDLQAYENWQVLLWELIAPYGFDSKQTEKIAAAFRKGTGKWFVSSTHRLAINRGTIDLTPITRGRSYIHKTIEAGEGYADATTILHFESLPHDAKLVIDPSPGLAYLDKDKIIFPLIIRNWKKGDRFQPLGMKGKKLLSDYFTDGQFSLKQKEEARLLCNSNGDIIWLIGERIDHRYRITKNTKTVLRIRIN
jgi:tRNA(Ile)-lysidine synthase